MRRKCSELYAGLCQGQSGGHKEKARLTRYKQPLILGPSQFHLPTPCGYKSLEINQCLKFRNKDHLDEISLKSNFLKSHLLPSNSSTQVPSLPSPPLSRP